LSVPLYEYECTKCGERVEILKKISDAPYSHCPKCCAEMRKLISSPAIQFKGSGFYKTDYASKPAAESRGESKSETKSEAKSDGKSSSTEKKS
jgi:putative FmdB family regulatory protein